jgi:hypothetical protein
MDIYDPSMTSMNIKEILKDEKKPNLVIDSDLKWVYLLHCNAHHLFSHFRQSGGAHVVRRYGQAH